MTDSDRLADAQALNRHTKSCCSKVVLLEQERDAARAAHADCAANLDAEACEKAVWEERANKARAEADALRAALKQGCADLGNFVAALLENGPGKFDATALQEMLGEMKAALAPRRREEHKHGPQCDYYPCPSDLSIKDLEREFERPSGTAKAEGIQSGDEAETNPVEQEPSKGQPAAASPEGPKCHCGGNHASTQCPTCDRAYFSLEDDAPKSEPEASCEARSPSGVKCEARGAHDEHEAVVRLKWTLWEEPVNGTGRPTHKEARSE